MVPIIINKQGRIFVFAVTNFCLVSLYAPSQDTSNVYYWNNDHRLAFSDFRGKPDSAKALSDTSSLDFKGGALISSGISLKYEILSDKVLFKIRAEMRRNNSWIKLENDSGCLRHEQDHFDICEIYARRLRQRICKMNSWQDIYHAYEDVINEQITEQKKFDEENTFLYKGIRKQWREKIESRLQQLYPFRNPNVLVSIIQQ